jgi:hypothetical protein
MADVVTLRHESIFAEGEFRAFKYAKADVAASQTDSAVVAAVAGKRIVVVAANWLTGASATTLVFNTKPSGAGTAITGVYANDINGGMVLPFASSGWFQTAIGEGLSVTTGAGASTGINVVYFEEPV